MTKLLPIQERIWDMKYRFKKADGTPIDITIEHTWERVATALAAPEGEKAGQWQAAFYEAMDGFKFIPGGRILCGAGTDRRVTLFNCFVMGQIHDSMVSIMDTLSQSALTMQNGGGIGVDFSTLRPSGELVRGVAAEASGPLPFMDSWDAMCRTIMSAGIRRGAMMGTMRCDHPDIEAFIEAKRDPSRFRMFNLSVLVTDAFMQAVDADLGWALFFGDKIYKTVGARELWEKILRATYDVAEPGVLFIDRMNCANPLNYCETLYASNPCGEQPLPPYGACNLGSINLAALVEFPFSQDACIDGHRLTKVVETAVRMLDNVIDVSRFPLEPQRDEARNKRRIGLGITGLADALAMHGVGYGSIEAQVLIENWMTEFRDATYRASIELAREKGRFPLYEPQGYANSPTIQRLPPEIRREIAESGIRNGLVTTIAPTGTTSLLAGNISSGIEPIYAISAQRKVMLADGSYREETVHDWAAHRYLADHPNAKDLPKYFVTHDQLEPRDHLAVQALAQGYIDSSISKTINCPEDIDFEAFKGVYESAYKLGCKGCTTYRPNPVTGSVLSTDDGGPGQPAEAPLERPDVVFGSTYKIRWPESDHAIYITINDVVVDGVQRPLEIFINSKNMEHYAWTVALTRMISAVFRKGGDVSFVVEELKAVFDPRGGAFVAGAYVPSVLAAIGGVVEEHLENIGMVVPEAPAPTEPAMAPRLCPRCSQPGLLHQEGCEACPSCGYSNCG